MAIVLMQPDLAPAKESPAEIMQWYRDNLQLTLDDVDALTATHDAQTKKVRGRPSGAVEVFKRSAFILSITGWEAFIEDVLFVCFHNRVANAADYRSVENTLNAVATEWLARKPKPEELGAWTGEGWKLMLIDALAEKINKLNTPNTKNVRDLSKRFLGFDLTNSWTWPKTKAGDAQARLDAAISRRGELVHRGKSQSGSRRDATRAEVVGVRDLVARLADASIKALIARTEIWGGKA